MKNGVGQPKLYYLEEKGRRKAILIFDPGYVDEQGNPIGFVHIYEQRETVPRAELQSQLDKYGHSVSWILSR